MKILQVILLLLSMATMSATVTAAPITFSFEGVVSGQLGTTPFSNVNFEAVFESDTDNNIYFEGVYQQIIPFGNATISLSGLGTMTFFAQMLVYNTPAFEWTGFVAPPFSGPVFLGIYTSGQGMDTYDLTTSVGPIFDANGYTRIDPVNVVTDLSDIPGTLTELSFSSASNVTFMAEAVPIPAAVWLFGSALGLLSWFRRKTA